jgi:3-oxoacyl-[acyl-carrier protein] reductase
MSARVVIVSGVGRGLGLAIARHLLERGDRVAGFARRASPEVAQLAEAPETRDRFVFEAVDLVDREALRGFVHRVVERWERVDALINNASVVHDGLLALARLDDIDATVDTNLRGTLHLVRACLRPMLAARRGRIVNVSSVAGLRGYSGLAAYSATKGALDALTRALAREVGGRGITVNSIAPGYLDETGMSAGLADAQRRRILNRTPMGRLGSARDILPALDFLLSPGADFITGQVLVVDGGLTC